MIPASPARDLGAPQDTQVWGCTRNRAASHSMALRALRECRARSRCKVQGAQCNVNLYHRVDFNYLGAAGCGEAGRAGGGGGGDG